MNTKIIISPSANGEESRNFANMLHKMYLGWAFRHNFVVHDSLQEGIVTLEISVDAKQLLQEHGIHRLCRISPNDPQGRRWTSFASVEIEGCDKPLERLRSYTLDPYKQALDLQKRYSTEYVDEVLSGGVELDKMMEAAVGEHDIPGASPAFIEHRTLSKEEMDYALTLVPTIGQ